MSRRAPEASASSLPKPHRPATPGARERLGALGHLPELAYALAAIVAVTALYGLAYSQAGAFPTASSLVGHGIGVAGFVLMLMTATLYSLRKRRADARWGSTAAWLKFHMVTGLVGPYMVLLHTAMKFNGLAGLAMLLTIVVVASGLVGRYIYTRIPRIHEGAGISTGGGGGTSAGGGGGISAGGGGTSTGGGISAEAGARTSTGSGGISAGGGGISTGGGGGTPSGGGGGTPSVGADAGEPGRRLAKRRRALATWHTVHVPLTWALFAAAFVHVLAALYYATLQR